MDKFAKANKVGSSILEVLLIFPEFLPSDTCSIKHAFSKKPNKLMLYMLDDYEVEYGIDVNGKNIKHEFGIYFTDLEKYLDFKITGIEDIIIHYEKILEFIEYLDSCQDYIMFEHSGGYYTEYKKRFKRAKVL